jgi:hypothetical protein
MGVTTAEMWSSFDEVLTPKFRRAIATTTTKETLVKMHRRRTTNLRRLVVSPLITDDGKAKPPWPYRRCIDQFTSCPGSCAFAKRQKQRCRNCARHDKMLHRVEEICRRRLAIKLLYQPAMSNSRIFFASWSVSFAEGLLLNYAQHRLCLRAAVTGEHLHEKAVEHATRTVSRQREFCSEGCVLCGGVKSQTQRFVSVNRRR